MNFTRIKFYFSLWEVWQNCLNGAADFKELIPEFFDGSGEFMINSGVQIYDINNIIHVCSIKLIQDLRIFFMYCREEF